MAKRGIFARCWWPWRLSYRHRCVLSLASLQAQSSKSRGPGTDTRFHHRQPEPLLYPGRWRVILHWDVWFVRLQVRTCFSSHTYRLSVAGNEPWRSRAWTTIPTIESPCGQRQHLSTAAARTVPLPPSLTCKSQVGTQCDLATVLVKYIWPVAAARSRDPCNVEMDLGILCEPQLHCPLFA
ncbi:hypothetical protein BD289DRAFT_109713 [Coniella lustricola]|uniref:Uncharacterized protein n=1 Tax=Coniella lustricola TaxID=2025994 RepID=A0A2T2ZXF1_9PEZI|nr:hypothetical protein BD289DRAFT_109713 [Coniella lustricola]